MRLGFIGLGNMGEHMSWNLIKAGHQVVVHDATQHRGIGIDLAYMTLIKNRS